MLGWIQKKSIGLLNRPIPFEAPLPAAGCSPLQVSFNSLEGLLDSSYQVQWEIGEGISSEEISFDHQYENPGVYDIWLSVTSASGCEFSATYPEWVVVEAPPVATFSYSPDGVVDKKELIQFDNQSENAIKWHWKFGDMSQSIEEHPSHQFWKQVHFL